MSNNYSKIRFIGFAIPTTPAQVVGIGDINGAGMVAGTYLGDADTQTDITKRIAIMKHAVDTAKSALPTGETDVVNVFVAPEFYFHGLEGPYVYAEQEDDPIDFMQQSLSTAFNATDYSNWTFICGSVITALVKNIDVVYNSNSATTRNAVVQNLAEQWQASFGPLQDVILDMLVNFIKNCHSYPNCEIRDRSVIVSNIPIRTPQVDDPTNLMATEKYYVSNEDLLLYDVTGKNIVTEQMSAYPVLDLSGGDAKQSAFDPYAIFRQNDINPSNPIGTTVTDYGVEICLDHSDVRLRRNIDNEPSVIGGIHVQLIPSCGMQIHLPSVATDENGFVFNCDGEYVLNDQNSGQSVISNVDCLYANYTDSSNSQYQAHSQLARVDVGAVGGDPNAPGSSNATLQTLDAADITVIPVPDKNGLSINDFYAGGPGQIHIYGLSSGYTLYPE
ncbi:MAG: hypothetical protein HRT35_17015 [Algicola sp.]|nr:hypothetical protein [Algicola sp.]